jgi:hypothetical protein
MRRLLLVVGASIALIAATLIADAPSGERWCVTHQAGIHHRRTNRVFDNPYAKIMAGYTALGASVAMADLDRVGFDDFFLTDSSETGKNRLYRNKGNFTFTDVAEEAGGERQRPEQRFREDRTGVSELRGSATRMFTNHLGLSTPAIFAKSRGAAVYRCMAG